MRCVGCVTAAPVNQPSRSGRHPPTSSSVINADGVTACYKASAVCTQLQCLNQAEFVSKAGPASGDTGPALEQTRVNV